MVDKIVNAINEILGGDQPESDPPKDQPAKGGFTPDDAQQDQQHSGEKGRNLDQLLSDAKKQVGENPQ